MKNGLWVSILLFVSCFANASLIFTDQSYFYTSYENPTGVIDFSLAPINNPTYSIGDTDYFQGESWVNGIVFETRSFSNLNRMWQAVARKRNGLGEIFAIQSNGNLPSPIFSDATITIQQYRPQSILAIYSSAGFFGWAPELNTSNIDDALFVLPIGATISKVEYGFSLATLPVVKTPEPPSILLMILVLCMLTIRNFKVRSINI